MLGVEYIFSLLFIDRVIGLLRHCARTLLLHADGFRGNRQDSSFSCDTKNLFLGYEESLQ